MPNMPKVSREQMWIVLGVLGVVGILAALKIDLTPFLLFAGTVLTGIGVLHVAGTKSDVTEVKTQVNGNNQRLVSAVMVALAHTPADKAPEVLAQLGLSGALPGGAPPVIPSPREPVDGDVVAVE